MAPKAQKQMNKRQPSPGFFFDLFNFRQSFCWARPMLRSLIKEPSFIQQNPKREAI
jgi:hypothetical protein